MKNTYIGAIGVGLAIVAGAFLILNNEANAPLVSPSPSASTTATPSQSQSPSPAPTGTASAQNIIVITPTANAVVNNPITVTGKARVFEGAYSYALRDVSGVIWAQGNGQAGSPDNSYYRDFSAKIPVPVGTPRDLILEVFEYSAKDGSIINLVRVPVRLATQQTATVQVYLNNRRLNTNDSCDSVFPVTRTVLKTQEPAYIALYELLRGPVDAEKDNQYYTSIPEGVKINSLKIVNGVAYADFNSTLEYQVGGSCRVGIIRAQITNTLKQFTTVKNVVISVDGRVEDALQP